TSSAAARSSISAPTASGRSAGSAWSASSPKFGVGVLAAPSVWRGREVAAYRPPQEATCGLRRDRLSSANQEKRPSGSQRRQPRQAPGPDTGGSPMSELTVTKRKTSRDPFARVPVKGHKGITYRE